MSPFFSRYFPDLHLNLLPWFTYERLCEFKPDIIIFPWFTVVVSSRSFFPLFIISANEASEPIQKCSFPLKLFAAVVSIANGVFCRASLGRKKVSATETQMSAPPSGKSRKHVGISGQSEEFS